MHSRIHKSGVLGRETEFSRSHVSQISIPLLFHYSSLAHSWCAGKENDPIIDLNIKQRAATAGGGGTLQMAGAVMVIIMSLATNGEFSLLP